jgi:hypothetical protein
MVVDHLRTLHWARLLREYSELFHHWWERAFYSFLLAAVAGLFVPAFPGLPRSQQLLDKDRFGSSWSWEKITILVGTGKRFPYNFALAQAIQA